MRATLGILERQAFLSERLSYNDLLRVSEPKRVVRSLTVRGPPLRVDAYQNVLYYGFNFKANPSTTGLRRHGYIKIYKPRRPMAIADCPCEVDCPCEDFRYRWAFVDKQHGSSHVGPNSLNQAWNRAPRITNPQGRPGLCKHLIALTKYLEGQISSHDFIGTGPDSAEMMNQLVARSQRIAIDYEGHVVRARERERAYATARAARRRGEPSPSLPPPAAAGEPPPPPPGIEPEEEEPLEAPPPAVPPTPPPILPQDDETEPPNEEEEGREEESRPTHSHRELTKLLEKACRYHDGACHATEAERWHAVSEAGNRRLYAAKASLSGTKPMKDIVEVVDDLIDQEEELGELDGGAMTPPPPEGGDGSAAPEGPEGEALGLLRDIRDQLVILNGGEGGGEEPMEDPLAGEDEDQPPGDEAADLGDLTNLDTDDEPVEKLRAQ